MKIHITARHLKVTPAINNYVAQKVEKAQRYFDHIVWAQVVLFIEKRAHKAEIVLHAPRQTFRVMATAADLYSAVDLASDKIDHQLKKYKERLRDHHKTPEPLVEDAAPAAAPLAIPIIRAEVSPITAEEAVTRMEDLGHDFLMFQDRRTKQIHVVYRRGDDSYAVLQPVRKT